MKYILIVLLLAIYSFGYCQKIESFSFMKSLGAGYYSIPNKINQHCILPNYQNAKNRDDTILLEKLLYANKKNKIYTIIGNVVGAKSAIILELRKINSTYTFLFSDEIPPIDSLKEIKVGKYMYIFIYLHYSDICSSEDWLMIYSSTNYTLSKSFEGIRKEEFYNSGDPICLTGISYSQNFHLKMNKNAILLIAEKKIDHKLLEKREYYFINDKFK